ncbi:longifolia 1-like protein [Tanacetum coccineum]
MSSMNLRRVMQIILSLGNALNQAAGFKLDSLLKLNNTRAKRNLMHYLCKVQLNEAKAALNATVKILHWLANKGNDQPKENRRVDKNNFAKRLVEDEPVVELSRLVVEQPGTVSVLDALYIEDTPSPVKNKPYAFNGTYFVCPMFNVEPLN